MIKLNFTECYEALKIQANEIVRLGKEVDKLNTVIDEYQKIISELNTSIEKMDHELCKAAHIYTDLEMENRKLKIALKKGNEFFNNLFNEK